PWDDEGTMMMEVKLYLQGHTLYTDIWSGYGPFYFFYNWVIHAISGAPATHDVNRFSAILPSLVCPLLCAWYSFQFHRSIWLASAVHLFTFSALWFFSNEPGHPQQLCILLLVTFIAAGQLVSMRRWHVPGLILLGGLAAALCLVKINLGIFVIVA